MKALTSNEAAAPDVQTHSATSAAETQRLIDSHSGAQRLLDIYKSSPANHQVSLLALNENTKYHNSKDARFKDYIDDFDRPYSCSNKVQPFRFMDLPAELRLKIIRNASITKYQPFFFWKVYTPTTKTGRISFCSRFNALRQIYIQIYAESGNMFWKDNTLGFSGDECKKSLDVKTNYEPRHVSGDTVAKEAIAIFVRNM